jgi:putative endonuclease
VNGQRASLGRWGEDAAAGYLQASGYAILGRNLRLGRDEIDLVARKEDLLIFVEVKTRTSSSFAYPEDSVTMHKRERMLAAAERYLDEYPESPESWQFDVIAVEGGPGQNTRLTHFENVIS